MGKRGLVAFPHFIFKVRVVRASVSFFRQWSLLRPLRLARIAAIALWCCAVPVSVYAGENDFYIPGVTLYRGDTTLPDVPLVDHHGRNTGVGEWRGKWMVLYFGYLSCPDACPTVMAVFKQVWKTIRHDPKFKDTRIGFVSLDPHRDTTDQVAEYIAYFDPEMTGFTALYRDLVSLAAAVDVDFEYQDVNSGKILADEAALRSVENYYVNHSSSIVVVGPQSKLVAHIHGTQDPQAVVEVLGQIQQQYPLQAPK